MRIQGAERITIGQRYLEEGKEKINMLGTQIFHMLHNIKR
jgi:hypothetical protein